MTPAEVATRRLAARRQEQVPQALARLAVVALFIALWFVLLALRIPMPLPFLAVLCVEATFFVLYLGVVPHLPSARLVVAGQYVMLGAEIIFHTTMVYVLGGVTWLAPFAYVIGLIFANTFLDLRGGAMYTVAVCAAFISLALLDATGAVPHYAFLAQDELRYADPRFVATTLIGATGVFMSIYVWVNWVGHQLRQERNTAVQVQDELLVARAELEDRVRERTADLEAANARLADSEELLRATIESTADGILVVDEGGSAAYYNARFAEMWRIPEELLATRDDRRLIAFVRDQVTDPDAFVAAIAQMYASREEVLDHVHFKDGRVFERFSRPLLHHGEVRGRVWSFRDVTERERAAEVLRRQARHDALTATLNHAAITESLREIAASGGTRGSLAVLMVDVDGMKAVNDSFGHLLGDAVLVAVAQVLDRDGAVVGRYGGDEFLVVLPGASREAADAYCAAVRDALVEGSVIDPVTGSSVPLVASIGVAMFPDEADSIDDAIRVADVAMYSAKRERHALAGQALDRDTVGDERAARMVGEIVPLLTSPGRLADKLRMVAHRLSIGAGYDVVRFNTSAAMPGGAGGVSTYARLPAEFVDAWNEERRRFPDHTLRTLVEQQRAPVLIADLEREVRFTASQRAMLRASGVRSALVVPMLWQDQLVGALSIATKREGALDARDVQFLTAVAAQVTAIVRMETLVEDLQAATGHLERAREDTVLLLAAAAEAHDHATGRHLHRVRELSEAIARELGRSEDEAQAVGLAAVLHDIGKIRVPETILLSPAQLDDDQWRLMKQHTTWGAEFLQGRAGFELAEQIARCHHERWDGRGYPAGLKGDEIPEVAQIVSVADSLDAITSNRPYRAGQPAEWAVREIARCGGQQFSPRVVAAMLRLWRRGELPLNGAHEDSEQEAA